jgi:hypothetical protein
MLVVLLYSRSLGSCNVACHAVIAGADAWRVVPGGEILLPIGGEACCWCRTGLGRKHASTLRRRNRGKRRGGDGRSRRSGHGEAASIVDIFGGKADNVLALAARGSKGQ